MLLQHGCTILVKLSRDLFKIYDPLVSVQGQNEEQRPSRLSTRFKWRTTTLSSQYKVSPIQKLWPSRLSTRSKRRTTTFSSQYKVKMKNNDPLVSVQGQFIQNLRPSHLSIKSF